MNAPVASPDLQGWIGRSAQASDTITGAAIAGLYSMLDRGDAPAPAKGTPIPPLGHWF